MQARSILFWVDTPVNETISTIAAESAWADAPSFFNLPSVADRVSGVIIAHEHARANTLIVPIMRSIVSCLSWFVVGYGQRLVELITGFSQRRSNSERIFLKVLLFEDMIQVFMKGPLDKGPFSD